MADRERKLTVIDFGMRGRDLQRVHVEAERYRQFESAHPVTAGERNA